MSTWYVCLIENAIVPFAEDEAILRAYMSDVYKEDEPVIYKVDDEKLKKICNKYCCDQVFPQWEDLYFTDSEAEMVSQSLEEDAEEIANAVKLLLHEMKYFDTPAGIKLKKALKEFKKERIENDRNIYPIDEYDFQERLFEKVNLKKYTKRIFKNYRDSYFGKDKKKKGR